MRNSELGTREENSRELGLDRGASSSGSWPARSKLRASKGQAMVEFVVALIAIIVLFCGLVQIGRLGNAQTEAMMEARRRAGINSIMGALGGAEPDYISEWNDGPDEASYSADDEIERGNIGLLTGGMVGYSRPNRLSSAVGPNLVSSTADDPYLVMTGFQEGEAERNVPLMPVIRNMIYNADSIDIESTVWMPESGDIY